MGRRASAGPLACLGMSVEEAARLNLCHNFERGLPRFQRVNRAAFSSGEMGECSNFGTSRAVINRERSTRPTFRGTGNNSYLALLHDQ